MQISPIELHQMKSYAPLSMKNTDSDISSISWTEKSVTDTNSSATDNSIREKLPTITKRKKIILITIISIFILIIIIMLAVLIPRLTSNSTTETNTSTNNTSVNGYTGTTTVVYDVGGGGTNSGSPCSSYTVINDPSRSVDVSGIGGGCDNGPFFNTSIGGRWIRFMGTGGTIMPSTQLGMNRCGSFLAGWFNQTLPSVVGTINNGTICFDAVVSICAFRLEASVINCATFYVYFLPPVAACNARYCTI